MQYFSLHKEQSNSDVLLSGMLHNFPLCNILVFTFSPCQYVTFWQQALLSFTSSRVHITSHRLTDQLTYD